MVLSVVEKCGLLNENQCGRLLQPMTLSTVDLAAIDDDGSYSQSKTANVLMLAFGLRGKHCSWTLCWVVRAV
jgi:hexokinase